MPARAPRRASLLLCLTVVATLGLAPVIAGCGPLNPVASEVSPAAGEGDVQTEVRDLTAFSRVSVGVGMKVVVGVGDKSSVTVQAQPNLLPLIKTEVVDGQLIVTIPSPGVTTTEPMSLSLRVPELTSVALSSGAQGYVEHTGGPLNLDASGGASITAIGTTPDLTLTTAAGGKALLGELTAGNATISMNDGSTAELTVTGALSGTASGGSSVVLIRKPASVSVETTSGATIQGG